ncbi:hypothetical protein C1T17_08755 [Sphingobium sp. SCG-1]|uniref:hypothetical protein n=1 Tax=Sphingobium sp. SCG-1 TaxID=2072936 RepID=UPI000CD6C47D|nr:hypothetical protein [Sphingobium sp. SCG-1]AUW58183.1 hypothetical protein C1T17_08755 [Sphingobium sp. SCG-1]
MNNFNDDLPDRPARDRSERHLEGVRLQGGMFVEAVRVTRMSMMVTDARIPGNPIIFVNAALVDLSGYASEEVLGQAPHFMNGVGTDVEAVADYGQAMVEGATPTPNCCNIARTASRSGPCSMPRRLTMARVSSPTVSSLTSTSLGAMRPR